MDNNNNLLFSKVWNNIVIFKLIFSFVRLYNKNKHTSFNNLKMMKEYKEREYIDTLEYCGNEILEVGDLPINGVLKKIIFSDGICSTINGNVVPIGVESIDFGYSRFGPKFTTKLSSLPNTIHTVENIRLLGSSNEDDYQSTENQVFEIPPNITYISFTSLPCISLNNGFKIPNTVKHLTFPNCSRVWNNHDIPLRIGDIPDGVTNLNLGDCNLNLIPTNSERILPNSIKKLRICYGSSNKNESYETFNLMLDDDYYIPYFNTSQELQFNFIINSTIEKLLINCNGGLIDINSNLYKCKSIKNLSIIFGGLSKRLFPNSLPDSITKLKLYTIHSQLLLDENIIPNSVKKLYLNLNQSIDDYEEVLNSNIIIPSTVTSLTINRIVIKNGIIPPNLIKLHINIHNCSEITIKLINEMIKILPNSITTIKINSTLLKSMESFSTQIKFPTNIKIIYLNKIV